MTLNGVMAVAVILRHFSEFGSFGRACVKVVEGPKLSATEM